MSELSDNTGPSGLASQKASSSSSPDLAEEDAKLVTLAKSARARVGAAEGAAVRDGDGRSYTGVTISRPSFTISALQLAVANAVAAGASTLEAAVLITGSPEVDPAAVTDLTPQAPVLVFAA